MNRRTCIPCESLFSPALVVTHKFNVLIKILSLTYIISDDGHSKSITCVPFIMGYISMNDPL